LDVTLEELERMADETRRQSETRKLAAAQAKLEALRNRQRDVNEKTTELIASREDGGRRRRAEARKASMLTREQHLIHEETVTLRTELGQAVVYDFVLNRVVDWMAASADALGRRQLDPRLSRTQERIIGQLDMLIAAIADISKLPSPDEFERGGAGGKAGGQAGGQEENVVVPTLAELMVLKAMQTVLNEETVRAAEDYDADTATEAKLVEVRALASEQEQITALTQQVIEKAKERHAAEE
jgi:hypothetical protein